MYQITDRKTVMPSPGYDAIRELAERRLQQIGGSSSFGLAAAEFWVLEPADTALDIALQTQCIDLSEVFDLSDTDQLLSTTEWVEHHPAYACFEIVFITNDDGYAVVFFLPEVSGIDPDLLRFCKSTSTPSPHKESL
jgi:hypothetical protein